jgi:Uma2 family endonuclease
LVGVAAFGYTGLVAQPIISTSVEERPRYLAAPSPIVFPEDGDVPESQLHFELRVLLYQLLCDHLGLQATVGSDQFIYYDAGDPGRCVAPDVYIRLTPPSDKIRSWKTWERGAPDVAIEIVSASDAHPLAWLEKLQRYQSLGVRELIRFDPEAKPHDRPLRVWDRVQDSLLERAIDGTACKSAVLDLIWGVAPAEQHPAALRITRGRSDGALVLTREEARQAEAAARQAEAAARQAEAAARQAEAAARQAAEARVQELEAELARRS